MAEHGQDAATSSALAYAMLCSDFPELSADRLSLLESVLSSLSVTSAGSDSSFQLCPAFVAGAAHGACRKATASVDEADEHVVPGLKASAAPASQYSIVYAHGAVLRACAMLLSNDELSLRRHLAAYQPPASQLIEEHPLAADDYIPEVFVADQDTDASRVTTGEDAEVWAAKLDDDDEAYEPLELLTPAAPTQGGANESNLAALAPLPSRAEALDRLAHLMGSLSFDALAALPPGAWQKLGIGETARTCLRALFFGEDAPGRLRPWWMGDGADTSGADAANSGADGADGAVRSGTVAGASGAGSSIGSAAARLLDAAYTSLSSLLRDRLQHEPSACATELAPTLACLPEDGRRREAFLCSLVAADSPLASGTLPTDSWRELDSAVRTTLSPLLEDLSGWLSNASAVPVAPLFARSKPSSTATGPTDRRGDGSSSLGIAQARLDSALQLLRWYVDPPPQQRGAAGRALLSCGAPQLLTRLVLPSAANSSSSARLRLDGCWGWLLACCSRPHASEIRAFVCAVPAFGQAVRASEHLLERRPAQRAAWLLLLLSAQKSAMGSAASSAASAASREAFAEAARAVEGVVGDRGSHGGCERLAHALELVGLLNTAAGVLSSLLASPGAAPVRSALDAFRNRAQAAARAAQAEQAARLAEAAKRAASGNAGDDEDGEKRKLYAAGTATGASASRPPAGPPADGAEKESELLQRAAIGLKQLSQRLTAPGKGD